MNKLLLSCLAVAFLNPACVRAAQPAPKPTELLRAKQVCAQLVGIRFSNSERVFRQLLPFALDRSEIEGGVVVGSAGMEGQVHLRGGLLLLYGWANIPRGYPGYTEHPRIAYAELRFGRKQKRVFYRPANSESPNT